MLKVIKKEPIIVMVCFHTHKWTIGCVTSIRKHLPNIPILFIDNNPNLEDSMIREESYSHNDAYGNSSSWHKRCALELDFIRKVPNSFISRTDTKQYHGGGMNQAIHWCHQRGYRIMVHVDPDSEVTGKVWYEDLVNAIKAGNWMASGHKARYNELFMNPSAWDVEAAIKNKFDFMPSLDKGIHSKDEGFDSIFNMKLVEQDIASGIEPNSHWARNGWDTGLKNWYLSAKVGKAAYCPYNDFHHFWNGTIKRDE